MLRYEIKPPPDSPSCFLPFPKSQKRGFIFPEEKEKETTTAAEKKQKLKTTSQLEVKKFILQPLIQNQQ
jgi:hypothetical protein